MPFTLYMYIVKLNFPDAVIVKKIWPLLWKNARLGFGESGCGCGWGVGEGRGDFEGRGARSFKL